MVPPFFAPSMSFAGPLADSSVAFCWAPPIVSDEEPPACLLLLDVVPHAASPITATAAMSAVPFNRITAILLVLPGWATLRQRRVLGSNASRTLSPSQLRARVRADTPTTGSHRYSGSAW